MRCPFRVPCLDRPTAWMISRDGSRWFWRPVIAFGFVLFRFFPG
jgi:hypothetical protein